LLMRLWCLASFVPSVQSHSPAFSVDSVASGVQWCFIAWWPTFQSSFSQWLLNQVEFWSYAIHMYWSLLFVWGGLVAACFAVSRLQRLAQTAVTCPTLHFGPLSVVCGYMLLWWLSQYHDMVEAVPHTQLCGGSSPSKSFQSIASSSEECRTLISSGQNGFYLRSWCRAVAPNPLRSFVGTLGPGSYHQGVDADEVNLQSEYHDS